jgi:hypothetical protein
MNGSCLKILKTAIINLFSNGRGPAAKRHAEAIQMLDGIEAELHKQPDAVQGQVIAEIEKVIPPPISSEVNSDK